MATGPSQQNERSLRRTLVRSLLGLALVVLAMTGAYFGLARWIAGNLHVRAGLATLRVQPLPNGLPMALPDLLRGKLDLDVTGFVRNDNLIDVELRDAHWQAWVNDKQVGDGELGQVTRLPADREQAVTVQARIDALATGLSPLTVWREGRLDLRVVVAATAVVLGVATSQEFTFRGFDFRVDAPLIGQAVQPVPALAGGVP